MLSRPQDKHNISGDYTPEAHGFTGPIQTTISNYPYTVDQLVVQTAKNGEVPGFRFSTFAPPRLNEPELTGL